MKESLVKESVRSLNYDKVVESLRRVGVEEFEIAPEVFDRLVELEATPFNEDSRIIGLLVLEMAENLARNNSGFELTAESKKDLSLVALLHDVGKSGPVGASPEIRSVVQNLYMLRRKRGIGAPREESLSSATPIKDVLQRDWPQEAERARSLLLGLGLRMETMRDFWNAHGPWSYEILRSYPRGLNDRVIRIVGGHHILEGVVPLGMDGVEAVNESFMFNTTELYIEFMLIAADKYEAARLRGGKGHEGAIEYVRSKVAESSFKDNIAVNQVLDILDRVGEGTLRNFLSRSGQ